MNNQPLWPQTYQDAPTYPPLIDSIEVDVAIIGAGITGLTAAMQLSGTTKSVAVIEKNTIGSGTTGSSTANLYIPTQTHYSQIAAKFNQHVAAQVAHSRRAAIDYIEQTTKEYQLSCSFQHQPWYMFTKQKNHNKLIEQEYTALKQCKLAVSYTNEIAIDIPFTKAIKLENQARFKPLHYLYGLAEIISQQGGKIYEHTAAIRYQEHKNYCEIETPIAKIKARKLILATHTPIGFNLLQMKIFPYRSYAIAAQLTTGQYPNGLFWDIDNPFFSISSHSIAGHNPDLLIIAGNHHKTGQAQSEHAKHYQTLKNYLTTHFETEAINYQWSAQHYQPADGLPYIGLASQHSKHTYVATGYSADGLTYGTLAGLMLADSVLANPTTSWPGVYKSTRFTPVASSIKYIKENTNVLCQYLADYPGHVDAKSYTDIKPGEGKIVEDKGEKWAAYRDQNAQLHCVSAICTHMKCIVKWNDAEKTWDCPCHGSRFNVKGEVLEGPALTPLETKPL